MKTATVIFGVILVALLGFAAYVRLAPSDPAQWNADPALGAEGLNSHVAKVFLAMPPAEALAAFDTVAITEPRTTRLAGTPEEGRITYVSRSRLWGFPDYTTVGVVPDEGGTWLLIWGRSRFGQGDMGVNAARIGRWVAALPS
ncbi:MAG: DUF1499 domain-containing protein [Rhodobacteraceae bacterium]|jgi:uncharacterized protein (DUF1499 family)|nr:DUF1499 domain-containing protein [Paracoccaceae bacterium]